MIDTSSHMEQPGLVIFKSPGMMKVAILGNTGCSACHNSLCMLGNSEAKQLEVKVEDNLFEVGESVIIKINSSSGYKGVLWLYMVPFLLMMLMLTTALMLGYTEVIAGVLSLFILAPYYLILFAFQKRLAIQCRMSIIKK
ncbi:MAG: SoxR reducing system RseC family protein [Bacteroidota bacterium]